MLACSQEFLSLSAAASVAVARMLRRRATTYSGAWRAGGRLLTLAHLAPCPLEAAQASLCIRDDNGARDALPPVRPKVCRRISKPTISAQVVYMKPNRLSLDH